MPVTPLGRAFHVRKVDTDRAGRLGINYRVYWTPCEEARTELEPEAGSRLVGRAVRALDSQGRQLGWVAGFDGRVETFTSRAAAADWLIDRYIDRRMREAYP